MTTIVHASAAIITTTITMSADAGMAITKMKTVANGSSDKTERVTPITIFGRRRQGRSDDLYSTRSHVGRRPLDRSLKLLLGRFGAYYRVSLMLLSPILAIQLLTPEFAFGWSGTAKFGMLILQFLLIFLSMAAVLRMLEQEQLGLRIGCLASVGFCPLAQFLYLFGGACLHSVVVVSLVPAFCIIGTISCNRATGTISSGVNTRVVGFDSCHDRGHKCALVGQAVTLEPLGPSAGSIAVKC